MIPAKELLGYIISQLVGAIAAVGVLYLIVYGKSDFVDIGGFAANGYGELSPGGYGMVSVCPDYRVCFKYVFLLVILVRT